MGERKNSVREEECLVTYTYSMSEKLSEKFPWKNRLRVCSLKKWMYA